MNRNLSRRRIPFWYLPLGLAFVFGVAACGTGDDYAEAPGLSYPDLDDDDSYADDDAGGGSDDDGGAFPTWPRGHQAEWNCYICHSEDFFEAKGEPHAGVFEAPDRCAACHYEGNWTFTDPNAPGDHGATGGCVDCHADQHDRPFEDDAQCFTCHAAGDGAPETPLGHSGAWDCYICHEADFLGAAGEPHGHENVAPTECLYCHAIGTEPYINPDAPEGHGSVQNCLDCHQGQHGKTWQEAPQCFACHLSGSGGPDYPVGHKDAWDCYTCHAEDFLGANGEPHNGTHDAPAECLNCHGAGSWTYTNPDAPEGHGSTQDCLNCHQNRHGKTWTDKDECLVCHLPGSGPADYPVGHNGGWNCYLCHEEDFLGANGEPHDGGFTAPTECVTCHGQGSWTYTNPNAPEGHGSDENCLNCHQNRHGKSWTDMAQCFVCHLPGSGPPDYPVGHDGGWDCYICHEQDFLGANGEPHSGGFTAPSECLNCHTPGSWTYTNPNAPEGHGATEDCLNCHQSQHAKTWTDKNQCLVCHLPGSAPPDYPVGHEDPWNCYICHEQDFLGANGEPHGGDFTAPSECLTCHTPGSWTYTNPNAPEGHGSTEDCLNCHQNQHAKTWTDKDQCFVCHLPGSAPPDYPVGHEHPWNCYICHEQDFLGANGEPHGGDFAAPTECVTCHDQGSWTYTNPNAPEGHGSALDCLNCHQNQHGKTWTDRDQCAVCHLPGEAGPEFSNLHRTTWNCYICHQNAFNGSPREPHGGAYSAPSECLACHAMGSFTNPRHGPHPPDTHTVSWNCLSCHSTRHGKPWQDNDQCKLCHQI